MTKLKISGVQDDQPVTLRVKLPAAIHQQLIAYAEILKHESGTPVDPTSLIVPMLTRFMATDRAFARARRKQFQKGKDAG